MAKTTTVSVKLKNQNGRFKDDSGKQLKPFNVYKLEPSERVVKAIEIGLLEKLVGKEAQKESDPDPDETDTQTTPSLEGDEKKNNWIVPYGAHFVYGQKSNPS